MEVYQGKENKINLSLKKEESFNNNILKDKYKCDPVKKEANKKRHAKETKKRKTREDV